jgi:hypothetical protein
MSWLAAEEPEAFVFFDQIGPSVAGMRKEDRAVGETWSGTCALTYSDAAL